MNASLPIGTVVLLKDATKKVMIIGYYPQTPENDIFDYTGCLWPEGVISADKSLVFNHGDIAQIYFNGYVDEEQKELINKFNEAIKQLPVVDGKVQIPDDLSINFNQQPAPAETATPVVPVATETPAPAVEPQPLQVQPPPVATQPVDTVNVN